MVRNVLVTGGAGYIGSHTVLQLLLEGFDVVIVNSLENSSKVAVHRVKQLAGKFSDNLIYYQRWPAKEKDAASDEELVAARLSAVFQRLVPCAAVPVQPEEAGEPPNLVDDADVPA